MSTAKNNLDPNIIAEAAEWLMEMRDHPFNEEQLQKFEQWKNQSIEHQRAWQQAQQLQDYLLETPTHIKHQIFDDTLQRQFLNKFLMIAICSIGLVSAAYYVQQQALFADYRTSYAQQKHIQLADGTRIILNSKSAIDINYNSTERHIILHYGEIFIQTAKDSPDLNRPFRVLGQFGQIQSLGTQFDVREKSKHTQVAVLQHAVRIETHNGQHIEIKEGQQAQFNQSTISVSPIHSTQFAWRNGLIVADRISLVTLGKKVEQQYGIRFDIAPELQNLVISGTYPATDLQALISSLGQAYQLNITPSFFGKTLIIKKAQ